MMLEVVGVVSCERSALLGLAYYMAVALIKAVFVLIADFG